MKNDSVRGGRKISIPPTVLFSTIGRIDDVGSAVTLFFKRPGDVIFVVGRTRDEMGGSEYHRMLAREQGTPDSYGGCVPELDIPAALALYRAMNEAAGRGLLRSSHTPTLGGLSVAFALAAVGGGLGAEIDLALLEPEGLLTDDVKLFSESNSRFVITCAPETAAEVASVFRGSAFARIGTVTAQPRLRITGAAGRVLVDADIDALGRAFKDTLHGI